MASSGTHRRETVDATENEIVLTVRDLNVSIDNNELLHGVNLAVLDRIVVAIIGQSGTGKSVLLKTIARLMHLEASGLQATGQILHQGEDVLLYPESRLSDYRRKVSYISQHPSAFPMSVLDNVLAGIEYWYPLETLNNKKERARRALQNVGLLPALENRLDTAAAKLSAGQLQLLSIARALAVDSKVLLLDEPCAYVDPISASRIEDLIFELKEEVALVIVTHSLQQAARISNTTAYFKDGGIVEKGSTNKVFTNPTKRVTENYITGRFG